MFIHAVLFEIKPREVRDYRKDSIMWANFAKKESKGFISYFTMKREDEKNQYVSVYKWKTNSMISPASNPDSPQVVPYDTGKYTVIFNNGQDSSKVIVYPRPICFIPNSFTPNNLGPNMNEFWMIDFEGMSAIDVMVFSRDNVKLFETTDFQSKGWDGTYDGKLCPVGYYYYYVKYTSLIGKEYNITGYLQLLR